MKHICAKLGFRLNHDVDTSVVQAVIDLAT
jgi:hypothetical protein